MSKPLFFRCLGLVLALCLLASCAAFAQAGNDFKVGYTVLGNASNFFVNVNQGIVKACEARGIELSWTIDDRDASKMKTAIDTYVMQGADIIVDFTVLAETGTAIAADLNKSGIPMLSVDCKYEGAYFFGVNNEQAGRTAGEFVKEWVNANWGGAIDSVQVLYNEANGEDVKKRVSGASDVLVEAGLATQDALTFTNINSSGAVLTDVSYVRSLVVDYLTAHPADAHVVIIAQTDEQASAANAAVLSSGRVDDVVIVSHNCDMAVVDMLQDKEGAIIGTVNYNSAAYGEQIIEACAKILAAKASGEQIDMNFYNQVYVVNRDNVWDYYPEKVEG